MTTIIPKIKEMTASEKRSYDMGFTPIRVTHKSVWSRSKTLRQIKSVEKKVNKKTHEIKVHYIGHGVKGGRGVSQKVETAYNRLNNKKGKITMYVINRETEDQEIYESINLNYYTPIKEIDEILKGIDIESNEIKIYLNVGRYMGNKTTLRAKRKSKKGDELNVYIIDKKTGDKIKYIGLF